MLQDLTITNFLGIVHSELETLAPMNILIGANNEGKSSHADALLQLLCGRTRNTDRRGAGADDQIHIGARKAKISATFTDDIGQPKTFERALPGQGVTLLHESITGYFNANIEEMEACLSPRWACELKGEDLTKLLASILISPTADASELCDNVERHYGTSLADFLRPIAGKALLHPKGLEKWADEARKDVRGSLKEKSGALQALRHSLPAVSRPVASGEIDRLKQSVEDAHKKLVAEQARVQGGDASFNASHAAWIVATTAHCNAEGRYEEARRKQAALIEVKPFAVTTDAVESARRTVIEAEKTLAQYSSDADEALRGLSKLTGDGKCPRGVCARVDIKSATDAVNTANTALRNAEQVRATAASALRVAEQSGSKLTEWQANVEASRLAVDSAMAERDAVPVPGIEPKKYESGSMLDAIRDEHKRASDALRVAEQAVRDGETRKQSEGRINEIELTVATLTAEEKGLNELCGVFDARGLRARMLEDSIASFASDVNKLLVKYFGRQFKLERADKATAEDPWRCMATNAAGQWLPVSPMSWSERSRVSACFQAVIAQATGFNLIVLDETGFDPARRDDMFEFLLDIGMQHNIQSLMFSTAQGVTGEAIAPPQVPRIDGVAFWWIEVGSARRLEAVTETVAA